MCRRSPRMAATTGRRWRRPPGRARTIDDGDRRRGYSWAARFAFALVGLPRPASLRPTPSGGRRPRRAPTPRGSRRARSTSSRRYVSDFLAPCPEVPSPSRSASSRSVRAGRACRPPKRSPRRCARGWPRTKSDGRTRQRFDSEGVKRSRSTGRPRAGPRTRPSRSSSSRTSSARSVSAGAPRSTTSGRSTRTTSASSSSSCRCRCIPTARPRPARAIAAAGSGQVLGDGARALRRRPAARRRGHRRIAQRSSASTWTASTRTRRPRSTKARIDADHKLADDLGVKGTPTIFVDGREYDLQGAIWGVARQEIAARRRPSTR